MTRGSHSLPPRGSSTRRLALVSAPLVTCAFVGAGVALSDAGTSTVDFSAYSTGDVSAALSGRTNDVSRDADRSTSAGAVAAAGTLPKAAGRRWTTSALDLRAVPAKESKAHTEIAAIKQLVITGVKRNGYAQVLVNDKPFWVDADFLAKKKPTRPADLPVVGKPCPGHSGVESGLTSAARTVFRAVCNNFPQISSYGGLRGSGEHTTGRAIDIMVSDVELGTKIAEFLKSHAAELRIYDVLWRQQIYTQQRGGEGWRSMASRGSATANHYDHVHVSVY